MDVLNNMILWKTIGVTFGFSCMYYFIPHSNWGCIFVFWVIAFIFNVAEHWNNNKVWTYSGRDDPPDIQIKQDKIRRNKL